MLLPMVARGTIPRRSSGYQRIVKQKFPTCCASSKHLPIFHVWHAASTVTTLFKQRGNAHASFWCNGRRGADTLRRGSVPECGTLFRGRCRRAKASRTACRDKRLEAAARPVSASVARRCTWRPRRTTAPRARCRAPTRSNWDGVRSPLLLSHPLVLRVLQGGPILE
jgi:hypothetical protein